MTQSAANDLAWLSGDWEYTVNGRHVTEHWSRPEGGTLIGVSRTVKDGETTAYEHLIIRPGKDGTLEYVAKPHNQPEAAFKLIKADKQSVVFENKEHDFPQRIMYALKGDALTAAIEGSANGKDRRIEFPYKRVKG